jgi:hypothetical protein
VADSSTTRTTSGTKLLSRADAIADGVLIDVSENAKEAGFRYPVVLTRAVWERYVAVPPGVVCTG